MNNDKQILKNKKTSNLVKFAVVFFIFVIISIIILSIFKPFENTPIVELIDIEKYFSKSDEVLNDDEITSNDNIKDSDLENLDFIKENKKVDSIQNEIFSFAEISLDFSSTYEDLINTGIEILDTNGFTADSVVDDCFYCSMDAKLINKNGEDINATYGFKNFSGSSQKIKDGNIVGFSIDLLDTSIEYAPDISFPNGIKWGDSQETLIDLLGEPDYQSFSLDGRNELYWEVGTDSVLKIKLKNNKMNSYFFHKERQIFLNGNIEFEDGGEVPFSFEPLKHI